MNMKNGRFEVEEKMTEASVGVKAAVIGVAVVVIVGIGVVMSRSDNSYMEPIEEKIQAYNDRSYDVKTDMGVFYPDEVIDRIDQFLAEGDDYYTKLMYVNWEGGYLEKIYSYASEEYASRFGDDWRITFKKKSAKKLSTDELKKISKKYDDPYEVYPKSVLPEIYVNHSKASNELKEWFCEQKVKEAYRVTLEMQIEGSEGIGENEAEAIVVNYGGNWLLYGAGSPDDLVYDISFRMLAKE